MADARLLALVDDPAALADVRVSIVAVALGVDPTEIELARIDAIDLEHQEVTVEPPVTIEPSAWSIELRLRNLRHVTRAVPAFTLWMSAATSDLRGATEPELQKRGVVRGAAFVEFVDHLMAPEQELAYRLRIDGSLEPLLDGAAPLTAGSQAWPSVAHSVDVALAPGLAMLARAPRAAIRCVDPTLLPPSARIDLHVCHDQQPALPAEENRLLTATTSGGDAASVPTDPPSVDENDHLLLVLRSEPGTAAEHWLPSEWVVRTRDGRSMLVYVPAIDLDGEHDRVAVYVDAEGGTYRAIDDDGAIMPPDRSSGGAFHHGNAMRRGMGQVIPVAGMRPVYRRPLRLRPWRASAADEFAEPKTTVGTPRSVRVCPTTGTFALEATDPIALAFDDPALSVRYHERELGVATPDGEASGDVDIRIRVSASGLDRSVDDGVPSLWRPTIVDALAELSTPRARGQARGDRAARCALEH